MGRAEDIEELKALSNDPGVPEEVKAKIVDKLWALADTPDAPSGAAVDQPTAPGELGVKATFGKDWTPYGAGGQPIEQTGADRARDDAAMAAEADRVASMLDPRFSIVPQVLALQPATNHPGGDEAAERALAAGERPWVIYEPPVDAVRRHLYENPALLRTLSPDQIPTAQEIQSLTPDSPLYQSVADWMFKQANDVATEKGVPIVRYKDAPWVTFDPAKLSLKVGAADSENANRFQAFVLGHDDTATFGIGRANQELTEPTTTLTQQTRLGVNANVPHPSREVNAWTEEQYPLAYGAGQVVGAFNPRSLFARLWEMVETGSLAARAAAGRAIGSTRPGAYVAEQLSPGVKAMGGVAADAATGGVAAATGQAAQEVVDAASRGEVPEPSEAGERVKDAGQLGLGFAATGSGARRLSHVGAERIRDSPRYSDQYGRGLVRQAEPNLEWGPMSVIAGTTPNKRTRELVQRSSKSGWIPSDTLADEMAGPVGRAAADNARVSADRAGAARAGYHVSPEGRQPVPVKQALDEALRGTASHYQPQAGGRLRAVNDRPPPEQKVFNSLVGDVSTSASEGATKLTPEQAGTFLPLRTQVKLLKDDIEQASRNRAGKPDDRAAYLARKPARARDGIDAEIEDDIEDLIGFDKHGVPRTVDKRSAEYKEAQQQVIRSRVDAETVLEPFGGSLAEYLKQRGIDAVYVTPRTLDAERLDRLIEIHGADSAIGKAAAFDRRQLSAGGKKGGYHEMVGKQQDEAARHEKIQQDITSGRGEEGAFRTIAGLYEPHPGEGRLVDKVRNLADQAGVREQLERLRGLQQTTAVANRARGADRTGHPRAGGRLNPANYADMAPLRAFPILRALEGPLGPLEGAALGRLGLVGGSETADARARSDSGARGRYEAARARRLKEIQQEKAQDAQDAERRQIEQLKQQRRSR